MPQVTRFPLDTRQVWTLEYNTHTHPLYVERPITRTRLEELVAAERAEINEVYRRYGRAGHPSEDELDIKFEIARMKWDETIEEYAGALVDDWPDLIRG